VALIVNRIPVVEGREAAVNPGLVAGQSAIGWSPGHADHPGMRHNERILRPRRTAPMRAGCPTLTVVSVPSAGALDLPDTERVWVRGSEDLVAVCE
jgi:hypothetical protein